MVALLLVGEQGRVLVEPAVHVGLPVALVGQHVPAGKEDVCDVERVNYSHLRSDWQEFLVGTL